MSLVRFDRNDYSVPTRVRASRGDRRRFARSVRIVVDSHVVAEHVRDWESENVHYDPVHYLALLERKPNSLDFGKPFEQWKLPYGFAVLRVGESGIGQCGSERGRREFIKILRLLEKHSSPRELGDAIDRALRHRRDDGRRHPHSSAGRSRKARQDCSDSTADRTCKTTTSREPQIHLSIQSTAPDQRERQP